MWWSLEYAVYDYVKQLVRLMKQVMAPLIIVVPLPFKNQKSANSVKGEMQNLSAKIGVQIKPVFQSKKISQVLSAKEKKPPIVNNQCVVYKFQCDLCDTDYVGYTTRHLHQRIGEHKHSATWKTLGRSWPIEVPFEGQTILCFEKMQIEV